MNRFIGGGSWRAARAVKTAAAMATASLIANGGLVTMPPAAYAAQTGVPSSFPVRAADQTHRKTSTKTDAAIAQVLQTARPDTKGWTAVIVQLSPQTQGEAAEKSLASLGGNVFRHLEIIHSLAVRVPTKNLQKLVDLPCVAHVSADVQTKKTGDEFTVGHSGADVATGSALTGGYGLSGNGVTVAVLDSGVKNGKDFSTLLLKNRLLVGVNFVNTNDPNGNGGADDKLGHGTHVAGIIAGSGYASKGVQYYRTFTGIAPSANLISVRVLDEDGVGYVSGVLAGLNWIVKNQSKYNIKVLNISLGHPVYESVATDPLNQAVEAAWKAGIVVVCSAGNLGRITDNAGTYGDNEGYGAAYGTIQCPGNDPLVITVGATKNMDNQRADDKIATYSSRGPSRIDMIIKPDIIAPGNRVISVCADGSSLDNAFANSNDIKMSDYQYNGKKDYSKTYFMLSGTSMAAPVVSGAAALLLEKYPSLSPDTIKARLMLSADKWTQSNGTPDVLTYGAGYLNIPAALNNTTTVPAASRAISPTLIVNSDGTLTVDMNQSMWANASLWATGVTNLQTLWGTGAISPFNFIWADQALWGKASAVNSNQALWGKATASGVDVSPTSVNGE